MSTCSICENQINVDTDVIISFYNEELRHMSCHYNYLNQTIDFDLDDDFFCEDEPEPTLSDFLDDPDYWQEELEEYYKNNIIESFFFGDFEEDEELITSYIIHDGIWYS